MLEILQLNVIKEAADALIEFLRIGELFEKRPVHPPQFEQRREPVVEDPEGGLDLIRPAPGEIQRDLPPCHRKTPFRSGRRTRSATVANAAGFNYPLISSNIHSTFRRSCQFARSSAIPIRGSR